MKEFAKRLGRSITEKAKRSSQSVAAAWKNFRNKEVADEEEQDKGSIVNNIQMTLTVLLVILVPPFVAAGVIYKKVGFQHHPSSWILLVLITLTWAAALVMLNRYELVSWAKVPRNKTGISLFAGYKIPIIFCAGFMLTFGKIFFLPADTQKKLLRSGEKGISITIHGSKMGDESEIPSQIPAELKANLTYVLNRPLAAIDEIGLEPGDEQVLWLDSGSGEIPRNLKHKEYYENKFTDFVLNRLRHEVFPRMSLEDILVLNGADDEKAKQAKARLTELLEAALVELNKEVKTYAPGCFLKAITVTKVEVSAEWLKRLGYVTEEAATRQQGLIDATTTMMTRDLLRKGVVDEHGNVTVQPLSDEEALFTAYSTQADKYDPQMGTLVLGLMPLIKAAAKLFPSKP